MTDDAEMIKTYQEMVKTMDDYTFYHTSVQEAKKVFPEVEKGHVIVLKDFDERMVVFTGGFTPSGTPFTDFLLLHMFPTVANANEKIMEKVLAENQRKGVFLFSSDDTAENKESEEEFRKVAAAMRSKEFLFAYVDTKSEFGKQIAPIFGVEEASLPIVESVEIKGETMMYRHSGPITEPELKQFMESWKKGTLPRFYTSEPVPAENLGPVYKVVGKTFKQEVIESDKDVVVKFYAPWCNFCKIIEPIYEKLAGTLASNTNIKFCELDATKNDIQDYPIEGYPTIKYFPKADRSAAVTYDGDLTEDSISKFIRQQAKMEPETPSSEEPETESDTTPMEEINTEKLEELLGGEPGKEQDVEVDKEEVDEEKEKQKIDL